MIFFPLRKLLPATKFKSSPGEPSVTLVQSAKQVQVYFCKHHLNILVIISDHISFERMHGWKSFAGKSVISFDPCGRVLGPHWSTAETAQYEILLISLTATGFLTHVYKTRGSSRNRKNVFKHDQISHLTYWFLRPEEAKLNRKARSMSQFAEDGFPSASLFTQ